VRRYFLNFWIWWYLIKGRELLRSLTFGWNFTLGYFNVVPMLKNLFVPLYQDYSNIGILISIPIRLVWVIIGSFMQLIVTIPLVCVYLIYLVVPLLPIWGVATFFLRFL
jgi:hypothetical protein